ncbi:MAG TPA: hypothetical protein VFV92_03610 [Candidatus Bathyarchaeia archaeon]|nr:hypothetical protein [Candidatus Bathyarchaeia archaeon]
MTPGTSNRKGVEAIFSTPKEAGRTQAILGGLAIVLGITLTVVSVITVEFPDEWGRSAAGSYESLALASLGLFVLTCGGSITLAHFSRDIARSRPTVTDDNPPSRLILQNGETSNPSSPKVLTYDLRLAVFVQGCILLLLYAGLVVEYQSNPTMQEWIRSSLASARFLLNWGALLVSSFLVGILFAYSLLLSEHAD